MGQCGNTAPNHHEAHTAQESANMNTAMAVDSGYKTLPLSMLDESSTNYGQI